jgi:4-hydroxy-4-methyl-2-oxoglutarate aldolase
MSELSRRTFLGASGATLFAATAPVQVAKPPSVSLLADGLRQVGHDPGALALTPDIKPLTGIGGTVMGPAVTTKWELARGVSLDDAVGRFVFQPIDDAKPGSIWVVASGTEQLLSMFGDLIALAAKRRGMLGAVTDSGCRDVATMDSIGFPAFGKGTVSFGPGDVVTPVGANVPVVCGGVFVHPGDFIAADSDGVLVIPRDGIEAVLAACDELQKREDGVRREIDRGVPLRQAYSL